MKAGGQRTGTRRSTQRRTGWSGSWPCPWARNGTRNASGCPKHPTAGSGKSSASGGLVCRACQGAWGMGLGMSGVEHQAAATTSGRMSVPARRRDGTKITHIGGLTGLSDPFGCPARHCTLPMSRPPCPSLHRVWPVHPLTFPNYLPTAQAPSAPDIAIIASQAQTLDSGADPRSYHQPIAAGPRASEAKDHRTLVPPQPVGYIVAAETLSPNAACSGSETVK